MMTTTPAVDPAPVVPPIVKQVQVRLDPPRAFTAFTADFGRWWPLATHSVGGAASTVRFVDGQIVELTADGQRCVWGTVQRWDPPHLVAFSWHPGQDPEPHTDVTVEFVADGSGSLVSLTHSGWERIDAGADDLRGYHEGWDVVLSSYVAATSAS
jgi:uncharacterized protein YndB with AHSA1/START domain